MPIFRAGGSATDYITQEEFDRDNREVFKRTARGLLAIVSFGAGYALVNKGVDLSPLAEEPEDAFKSVIGVVEFKDVMRESLPFLGGVLMAATTDALVTSFTSLGSTDEAGAYQSQQLTEQN